MIVSIIKVWLKLGHLTSKIKQTNKKTIADNILYQKAVVAGWSVLPRRLTKKVYNLKINH